MEKKYKKVMHCKVPGCTRPGQASYRKLKKTGEISTYINFPKGFCEYHYFQQHPRRKLINEKGERIRQKPIDVKGICIAEGCKNKVAFKRKNNRLVFDKKGNIQCEKFCTKHLKPFADNKIDESGIWLDARQYKQCKIPNCEGIGVKSYVSPLRGFPRGFCQKHYVKWQRGQIDLEGNIVNDPEPAGCNISGCTNGGRLVKGYCYTHYLQLLRDTEK